MQRDYWYASARDARELESSESIGRKAGERAVARLGARKIATQKSRILYAPEVARGLIGHFLGAVRGSSQYRKSTFLLGAAGQQVFPSFVELRERPHILKALGSSPFDGEGVATRDRELVNDGVLQGYILGSYSARKLGLKTTGNSGGTHNVLVESKTGGMEIGALMRELGTGLLVTELMGQGVNSVTGDYSRGASGYWVENGVQAFPVHEITIAGNLKDMYRNIAAIGNDVDVRGGVRVGSILISEMMIAGD
jgi:PmbA protein